MATARLVYETPENLNERTVAHAKTAGSVGQLVATNDVIATFGQDGITVRGLDCEVRWHVERDADTQAIGVVGDELVAVGLEAINVWGLDGAHRRRFDVDLDIERTHLAFDEVGRQVAVLGAGSDIAEAAIIDLVTGERLHQWDMTEDYNFGDWIQVNGVMFHDGRLILGVGQQITVWVDGELERGEWRRGKSLGQHTDETWEASDRYLMEVTSEARGLVIYDAHSLEVLAQPGVTGDMCGEFGGDVFAWSDQHISIWDGDQLRFLKPDWRGHHHATFTPDGGHAISVSLLGKICVQRVADFEELTAEPPRVWAVGQVTAFAVNPSGTHACVVRGVPNTMARVDVVELAIGDRRELGTIQPTEAICFIGDRDVFAATGQSVSPVSVMTWSIDDVEVQTTELPGEAMGAGKAWVATKEDHKIVFRTLEAGALQDVATYELPKSYNMQTVLSTRYAFGYDDAYNGILVDLETREKFMTGEGKVGGDLFVNTEWDQEYKLKVAELPGGQGIGEWAGNVGEFLVRESKREVIFTTQDGQLCTWSPPDAVENVFSAPDLGPIKMSADERYLVSGGMPVRVFAESDLREPVLELEQPNLISGTSVSGDHLIVGGYHGLYAIYVIEHG